MVKLTVNELIALDPCNLEERLARFGKLKSMNAKQAFKAGFTIKNLTWVAARKGHKDLLVKFALKCAQSVDYLNTDLRVQAAIDAAQAWINNPTKENRKLAAYAAADAAYARQKEIAKQQKWFVEIFDGVE